MRENFVLTGQLPDTQDTDYRPIDDNMPVFGFAVGMEKDPQSVPSPASSNNSADYGTVGGGQWSWYPKNTLFQLSLHQHNCVQFESGYETVQNVACMWTNYFSNDTEAVSIV